MSHELSCNYGCSDLPNHAQVLCGEYLLGGINSIGILECGQTTITDFEDSTQYDTAIANGDLKLIDVVRGTLPDPSPINGVNPDACGSETILDGFDNTFEWEDYNISETNDAFYEALNVGQRNLIFFMCQADKIRVVELPVSFMSFATVPQSNKEKQLYRATAAWSSGPGDFPQLFDAPSGIFAQ